MKKVNTVCSKIKKTIAIIGSSRKKGNTRKFLDFIISENDINVITLSELKITPFDYNHNNKDDDFFPLIKELLKYDNFIFATPVYWYTFSSQMKIFIDRLSDLLTIEKDLGRRLRGKNACLVSTGTNTEIAPALVAAFNDTCDYLGIKTLDYLYHQAGKAYPERKISPKQSLIF